MFIVAHNGAKIYGGGESGTAKLLAALQERGHRVLMLCRDERIAARVSELGIPTEVHRLGGVGMLPHALRFSAKLRELRPDALILTTFKKIFLAGLGARLARVPLVVQRIVLSTDLPRRAVYRWSLRSLPDVVAVNAEVIRAAMLRAQPALARRPVVVTLYDGVRAPVAGGPPGALRAALGIPPGARVIGSVGRLALQKRYDRLVAALQRLPGVHLVIAGEGSRREALEALSRELGVADRVHLLGFRPDVGDVLAALDLYVVSSDSEGMTNAMLEAMAFGLPVVSTDVSGAREALVDPGGAPDPGVVVGFGERAIADAVEALLGDEPRRRAMAAAAKTAAAERFGWDRFVDEWEALLGRGAPR